MTIYCACADIHGCFYYRMLVPYGELHRQGCDVTFMWHPTEEAHRPRAILVLQRQESELAMLSAKRHRAAGGYVVYELDDDFTCIPPSNPAHGDMHFGKPAHTKAIQLVSFADLVIASTEPLARSMRRFNKNVYVCHNALSKRHLPPLPAPPPERSEIRIGWGGSITHAADFLPIVPVLEEVLRERPHARLEFIGDDLRGQFGFTSRFQMRYAGRTNGVLGKLNDHQGDMTRSYYRLIASREWDMAIAPILPNSFNDAKSFLKPMEYGACGVPALCSHFGPYRQYRELGLAAGLGEVIATASTPREWKQRLLALIDDALLRSALRDANARFVFEHNLIEHRIGEWKNALASLQTNSIAKEGRLVSA